MIFQLRGVVGVPDGSKTQQKPDFRAFQKPQSWFKKNCAEKYQLVIKLQHDEKKMVGFQKFSEKVVRRYVYLPLSRPPKVSLKPPDSSVSARKNAFKGNL